MSVLGAKPDLYRSFITKRQTDDTNGTQMTAQAVPEGAGVVVKALAANTGNIFIAETQAKTGVAADRFILAAGSAASLKVANTSVIWFRAATNGEGVEWIVEID